MNDNHSIEVTEQESPISQQQSKTVTAILDSSESPLMDSPPTKNNIDVESKTNPPLQKSKEQEAMAILFHELRNPLNGILGYVQLMYESLNSLLADINEYRDNSDMQCNPSILYGKLQNLKKKLKTIESCGKDQLTILNHVLDFNKLDQTSVALESKSFAILRDIFNPLIDTYISLSEEKGITLLTALPDIDQQLIGDPYRLKQILINLMSNAFKFAKPITQQSACIELSLSMHSMEKYQELHFKIKNTGSGLKATQIAELFKPYTQSDPSITRLFGGTGLGLVVCKQLLVLMKGDIVCTSSVEERWVQFDVRLSLPIARTVHHKRKFSEEKTKSHPSKIRPDLNARVLVVEDNHVNQKIILQMLKKFRCEANVAENGRQAIVLYLQHIYSLILMDIQMPEMDGLTATREIRSLKKAAPDSSLPPIPIIGLSADALTEQRDIALKAGMNDYLTKPILENDLYDKIAQYSRETSRSREFSSGAPRSGTSSLLFTRRLAPVIEDTICRLAQDSHSSGSSFSRMSESSQVGERLPTPSSSPDNSLLFSGHHETRSLSAAVLGLEPFQQPDRVGRILENKETVSTLTSSSLESTPRQWMQQLAETKADPVAKAQVISQAIDYYFRAVWGDDYQSIAHVSMTVSALPKKELKKWIERLENFYQTESTPRHQPLIAAVALGHWQSLRDQVAQTVSQNSGKHSLLQTAELHLMTWKQRATLPEKKLSSTETRSFDCCIIV